MLYKPTTMGLKAKETEAGVHSGILPAERGHCRPSPDSQIDRGWAWVVMGSSFLLQALSMGVVMAVGVYVVEWIDVFDHSRSAISWIGSLSCGVSLFCGPFASALCNRFSHRFVIIIGSAISSCGLLLSYFATNVYTLYLSFGMITGLGASFIFSPSFMFVGTYFSKYQSLALALCSIGNGAGPMTFAPLNHLLINHYGWRGAMMITSGILLNGCVLGALLCPAESWVMNKYRKARRERHTADNSSKDAVMNGVISVTSAEDLQPSQDRHVDPLCQYVVISDASSDIKQDIGCDFRDDRLTNGGHSVANGYSTGPSGKLLALENGALDTAVHKESAKGASVGSRRHRHGSTLYELFDISLLTELTMWVLIINQVLWNSGTYVLWVFVVDYGRDLGITDSMSSGLVSLIAGSGVITRIPVALLLTYTSLRPLHLCTYAGLSAAIYTFSLPSVTSIPVFVTLCFLFGTSIGALNGSLGVVTVQLFGVDRCTGAYSYQMTGAGLGALLGPPLGGFLYDAAGNYEMSFYSAATSMLLSGCVIGIIYTMEWWHKIMKKRHR